MILLLNLATDPQNKAIGDQIKRQVETIATNDDSALRQSEAVFKYVETGKIQVKATVTNKGIKDNEKKKKGDKL